MTISRIRSAGWSLNQKLTSAEVTQLDINASLAVDKTGDTTTGAIHIGTGSSLILDSGSTGSILSTVTIGAGGKLTTASTGKIEMGNNDYPALSSTHTGKSRTIEASLAEISYITAGSFNIAVTPFYHQASTAVSAFLRFMIPKYATHIGATLSSVDVYFVIPNTKTLYPTSGGQLPNITISSMPTLTVGSAIPAITYLSSTNTQFYPTVPANLAAWATNNVRKMTYTCNQNNVIDATSKYAIDIVDESVELGNQYYSIAFNYTNISDLRFA